jgi:hypothetical protein
MVAYSTNCSPAQFVGGTLYDAAPNVTGGNDPRLGAIHLVLRQGSEHDGARVRVEALAVCPARLTLLVDSEVSTEHYGDRHYGDSALN